jgi:Transposase DDE domain
MVPIHPSFWLHQSLQRTRQRIAASSFCQQHRAHERAFLRQRHFTFVNSILFLLQKTVRSIQLHVHAFWEALGQAAPGLTASAWSQARLKLRHSAFIALNEEAILQVVYQDRSHPHLRLWRGYRLVGIDSSLVRLPNQEELGREFGWVPCQNGSGACSRYPQARLSILTDLLNRIGLQTFWVSWTRGERELALAHLRRLEAGDLALMDRGYAAYELWAAFVQAARGFVCRCQAHTFGIVQQLFQANQAGQSVVVQLVAPREQLPAVRVAGLPEVITLRFVTVRLESGQLEVLATNLLDEALFPTECLAELYGLRWGIETYYGLLKGRLDLGHFTGLSAEAIRQDVHATVFISNLESLLIAPANEHLAQHSQGLKYRQQVNHAVSFHAIKLQIIALLAGPEPLERVIERLQELFCANPTKVRAQRKVRRRKPSGWRSYAYQRYRRKVVF